MSTPSWQRTDFALYSRSMYWIMVFAALALVLATVGSVFYLRTTTRKRSQLLTWLSGIGMVLALYLARGVVLTALRSDPNEPLRALKGAVELMKNAWPSGRPDQIFLVAMLLSFLAAFVLYHHFPNEYKHLDIGEEFRYLALHFILPSIQLLCAVVAILTLEVFYYHMASTFLYLLIFVIWDLVISQTESRQGELHTAKGSDFKREVKSYLLEIDLPTTFTFFSLSVLLVFSSFREGDFQNGNYDFFTRAFMAGVVASQAVAAIIGAMTALRKPTNDNTPPIDAPMEGAYNAQG